MIGCCAYNATDDKNHGEHLNMRQELKVKGEGRESVIYYNTKVERIYLDGRCIYDVREDFLE